MWRRILHEVDHQKVESIIEVPECHWALAWASGAHPRLETSDSTNVPKALQILLDPGRLPNSE